MDPSAHTFSPSTKVEDSSRWLMFLSRAGRSIDEMPSKAHEEASMLPDDAVTQMKCIQSKTHHDSVKAKPGGRQTP